jgi:hypothetical protein
VQQPTGFDVLPGIQLGAGLNWICNMVGVPSAAVLSEQLRLKCVAAEVPTLLLLLLLPYRVMQTGCL